MKSRREFLTAAAIAPAANAVVTENSECGSGNRRRKYRLGLVTYNVAAKWNLATVLRACTAAKIDAVEFRTTHAHGVEPTLSAADRKTVRQSCGDAGIAIWGCGSICEFHSPDRTIVERNIEDCKRFIGLVGDIGGRGVKVRPNGLPADVPREKTLEQIAKALVACGNAAADAGIEVWLEVHGPGTQTPANIQKIMTQCGHRSVGITWNSNASDIVNGSIAESFRLLQPWLKSCHINELYKDSQGKYPYRELFHLLQSVGYDRYTLIEIGATPPDVEIGIELLKYYRSLWEELSRPAGP